MSRFQLLRPLARVQLLQQRASAWTRREPPGQIRRGGAGSKRACSGGSVTLSESRMREFIKAEISHFARMSPEPVGLAEIVQATKPSEAAKLIHRVLPGNFATRIKHIETLPDWDSVEDLVEVHRILSDSFHNLRLVDQGPDLSPLNDVIRDLRRRHKAVVPLLGSAVTRITGQNLVDEAAANEWLDTFLMARISTEMLTAHYVALIDGATAADNKEGCWGIVDFSCDPAKICAQAAESIESEFRGDVKIVVDGSGSIEFSFLPQYLLLLLTELLKNSTRATIRHHAYGAQEAMIKVTVAADPRKVMIKISDSGGGLPTSFEVTGASYSWSRWDEASSFEDPMESWREPLAGIGIRRKLGMGIRLIRLYATYLGGKLHLLPLPNVGTDAYIELTRIDVAVGEESATNGVE